MNGSLGLFTQENIRIILFITYGRSMEIENIIFYLKLRSVWVGFLKCLGLRSIFPLKSPFRLITCFPQLQKAPVTLEMRFNTLLAFRLIFLTSFKVVWDSPSRNPAPEQLITCTMGESVIWFEESFVVLEANRNPSDG